MRPRHESKTAADHVAVFTQALGQLPAEWASRDERGRRPALVRTEGAGATHRVARQLHDAGVEYSLGSPSAEATQNAVWRASQIPETG